MNWRYLTNPTVEPVSYVDVKAQLRVDADDERAYLSSLIVAARLYAESDTQRTFIARQAQVTAYEGGGFFGFGYGFGVGWWWHPEHGLRLPRGPVSSVQSVTDLNGVTVDPTTYHLRRVGDTDYLHGWNLSGLTTVTYTAGYGPAAADVPQDVRTGILLHVAHLWENRSASTTRPQSHIALGLDAIYGQYRVGGVIG